jgi:tetratricopeptide (TPR) repeat protein
MTPSLSRFLRPAFYAALVFCAPGFLRAEHIMDSVDALTAALAGTQSQIERGDFSDAVTSSQKAVELAQERFGPTHPSVAPYFDNLAIVDQCRALYPGAESNFKWALALREKSLGSMDPAVAQSLVSLATLEEQLGRFEEADLAVQRALTIEKSMKSPAPPTLASTLDLAARIQEYLGRADQAVADLRLALQEPANPNDPPQLRAQILTHLARLESGQKKFSDAENNLQLALQITKKTTAPGSIETADALKSLADFYSVTGDLTKAADLDSQSLALDLHFIGAEDTYANIPYHQRGAEAYFALGKWKEADDLYHRILKIKTQVYGMDHPEVALTLENLSQTAEQLKDKSGAVKDLKEALAIFAKYLSPDHPLIRDVNQRLAALLKS